MLRKKEKEKRKKAKIRVTSRYFLNSWDTKSFVRFRRPSEGVIVLAFILLLVPFAVHANERLESPNYILDPNVANSFGGLSESDSYSLVDSGGEAAIGLGTSGSYKLSSGYISQLQQSIELNVLPAGLAAYYPLNTGVGIQAYDATPNSNRGVLQNDVSWASGIVGSGALRFDSVDNYVEVQHDSSLNFGNGSFTVAGWVYIEDRPDRVGQNHIFYKRTGNAGNADQTGFYLRASDNGSALFLRQQTGVGSNTVSANNVIGLEKWTHVVGVADSVSSELRLYVDGELVNKSAFDGAININNSVSGLMNWGRHNNHSGLGMLDEVQIYSHALSNDEVLDKYNASSSGIANALTLPKITAGASQTVGADAVVITDAGGYDLSIEQTRNLTRVGGSETIPAITSSISNPASWSEGTTVGLGFTVTSGTQVDPKWGTSPDYEYAAIPGSATTFHSRVGLTGGIKEVTGLEFRLGVSGDQASGMYKNRVGFTATLKP